MSLEVSNNEKSWYYQYADTTKQSADFKYVNVKKSADVSPSWRILTGTVTKSKNFVPQKDEQRCLDAAYFILERTGKFISSNNLARSHVKGLSANSGETLDDFGELIVKLQSEPDVKKRLRRIRRNKPKIGNCDAMTLYAGALCAAHAPEIKAEGWEIKNGDHIFIVLTYGQAKLIVDTWNESIFPWEEQEKIMDCKGVAYQIEAKEKVDELSRQPTCCMVAALDPSKHQSLQKKYDSFPLGILKSKDLTSSRDGKTDELDSSESESESGMDVF